MRGQIPVLSLVLLLVLLLALAAVTRLRLPSAQLGTVPVLMEASAASSARGRAVDALLLPHLAELGRDPQLAGALDAPQKMVELRGFWVDACEVRQGDYERFLLWLEKNPRRLPSLAAPGQPYNWRYDTSSRGHRLAGRLQSPASGVSYFDAYAYCRAARGRLPFSEEWQALAGGEEGRLYPWGDDFRQSPWPYLEADLNASQLCGLHPDTSTPEGVHDLAGGVMEWTQGQRIQAPQERRAALHGAPPERKPPQGVHALNVVQRPMTPRHRSHHVGFRCIYNNRPRRQLPWGVRPKRVRIPGGRYRTGMPPDARLPRLAALLPPERLGKLAALLQGGERKARTIRFGRCEVSRAHYRVFLGDPMVRLGLFGNENEPPDVNYTPLDWTQQQRQPALPVTGVDWWSADAFARWAGGRLPSADEWDIAAAGPGATRYPWGDEYDPERAMTGDLPQATPAACGIREQDLSAAGLHDLAGNVSEWTRSITVEKRGYAMLVKGGSYLLPGEASARNGFARAAPLNHRTADIGFRVVFD